MRTVTLLLMCLSIALVAGCQEGNVNAKLWMMGGPDVDNPHTELIGRVGLEAESIEVGAESLWVGVHGDHQSYGAYALGHLGEGPAGRAYIGYHASIIDAEDGGLYGPIGGTTIQVNDQLATVVEYQYRSFTGELDDLYPESSQEHRVYAGIVLKF